MGDAVHAEWFKLRSLRSTYWLVASIAVLTVGTSVAILAATNYVTGSSQDLPKLSLSGIDVGQAVVVVLAVLVMSNEYSTGLMTVTLTAMPRRLVLVSAKSATLIGLVAVGSFVGVGGSLIAGRFVLPGKGFTAAHGYDLISLGQGFTLRAAVGSVLYLVLVALLSFGVTTAVRDTAFAIGLVLGLLYLFPFLAQVVSNQAWQRHLEQIGPMTAGLSILATTNLKDLPIGPWAGLGVLAAWAAGALGFGALVFQLRDA